MEGFSIHIKGHGYRSAEMLKELGFHLSQDEFLAIRFHMSLKDKKNHPLYENACHCHLRFIVHNADGLLAISKKIKKLPLGVRKSIFRVLR